MTTAILIIVAILTIILIFLKPIINFLALIKSRFKIYSAYELSPKDIEQKVLISLAKLEKVLYSKGFTRRVIVELDKSYSNREQIEYKFYYYNLIEGIHAYIIYKDKKFYYYFETLFNSQNSVITSNYEIYIKRAIPDYVKLFIYKNSDISTLYSNHLKDRVQKGESIYKNRFAGSKLINYILFKRDEYLKKLAQRGYIIYTDYGYKFKPTLNLFKDSNAIYKSIYGKSSQNLKLLSVGSILIASIALLLFFGVKNYAPKEKNINLAKIEQIKNPYNEFKKFYKTLNRYSGLTLKLDSLKSYPLSSALNDLESYLKNSKIDRLVSPPLSIDINSSKNCKIPNALIALLKRHNGIEKIVPSRDLLRFSDINSSIQSGKKLILAVAESKSRGLVFKCNKSGLYEYDFIFKTLGKKEFYDFEHFLKVTALSYKNGAFFDMVSLNVDIKKYLKIYRNSFSSADKKRYESKINYLKNRAIVYKKYGNNRLKIALLKEIAKTFDSKLISSVKPFLKDNKKVRVEAISTLGDIGDRKIIKNIVPFLSSSDKKSVDFALIALSKLVTKDDSDILYKIYPILNDNSILVKISAYRVIAKIANSNSLNIIKAKFNSESEPVKLEIVKTLAKIGTINELPILNQYLSKVKQMDFSDKNIYRVKGVTPHPLVLKAEILNAINKIRNHSKIAQK